MKTEAQIINRLSAVGLGGNIALSAFKLFAGIFGNSSAMVSDALHSVSDVFATFIAYLGARIGHKNPDREHPFGHERVECVASILVGAILLGTGCLIGYEGIMNIIHEDYLKTPGPTFLALSGAIVSIIVKEAMFWYTMHYANIIDSDSFRADAWHHRSDVISSVGSLIGIGLAMLGFPIMDPIASLFICALIIKMGVEIIHDGFIKMVDTSCDKETEERMRELIEGTDGVECIDRLITRQFGNKILVNVEIMVDGDLTVKEGHDIAENVHNLLEKEFPSVKHVMVHVNPSYGCEEHVKD